MKTVRLGGILGEKFGKEYKLEVKNAREACRALSQMVPGFEAFMNNAHLNGIQFAVWHGNSNIGYEEIDFSTGADDILIDPVIGGAKAGVVQTIIGAILIVVGVVLLYVPGGQAFAPSVIGAGIGLLAGGIMTMLMPKANSEDQNNDGNKANKGFGGAVTTVAQGNPVPILYGERGVGGFIVSAEILPEDQQ